MLFSHFCCFRTSIAFTQLPLSPASLGLISMLFHNNIYVLHAYHSNLCMSSNHGFSIDNNGTRFHFRTKRCSCSSIHLYNCRIHTSWEPTVPLGQTVGYVLYSLHVCVWACQIRQLRLTTPPGYAQRFDLGGIPEPTGFGATPDLFFWRFLLF
jgi:hypothetical protein